METEPLKEPYKALYAYLVTGSDHHLCVLPNGSWYTKPYNIVEMSDPAGTVYITCCHIGNLDSTYWTTDFAERRDDGLYYELDGMLIGNLADVIRRCVEEGDVEGYLEDLEREIAEARKEAERDLEYYSSKESEE